ncbi:MAG: DUF427 domain-containing protein [Pseudomonadota bacterium]
MSNPAPGFEKHPNYEVNMVPIAEELLVKVGDQVIARSQRAVELQETKHRPVWYMPLADVDANLIKPTSTDTYCPFKGHASYWSVVLPDQTIEDAIWAYEAPYDECADIAGYASFYTNKVDLFIAGEPAHKDGPGFT